MPRVPMDDPFLRSWKQRMADIGLPETTPIPMRRGAGVGIGATISGREVNPPPRPRPSPRTMRSERPAPPSRAQRIWPGLKGRA
jgi:hypothetical protein